MTPTEPFVVEVQLKNVDTLPCYSALYAIILQKAEAQSSTDVHAPTTTPPTTRKYLAGKRIVIDKYCQRYNALGQKLR